MGFDCADAHVQQTGGLFDTLALGNELKDLPTPPFESFTESALIETALQRAVERGLISQPRQVEKGAGRQAYRADVRGVRVARRFRVRTSIRDKPGYHFEIGRTDLKYASGNMGLHGLLLVPARQRGRFRVLDKSAPMGWLRWDQVFKRGDAVGWRCRNCGYVHEGTDAPEMCPACAHPQAHFELLGENY